MEKQMKKKPKNIQTDNRTNIDWSSTWWMKDQVFSSDSFSVL